MSSATSTHSSSVGPLGLMSCVRESSPLQDFDSEYEKHVSTKKKMSWNPKKWFKKKNKGGDEVVVITHAEVTDIVGKDSLRSRSTSELSEGAADEQIRRRSGSSIQAGLSVSHDSVFHSPHSGSESDLEAAQSTSSLSQPNPHRDLRFQTELTERLRLRRPRGDASEDDEGLPHSPCNSPSATDGFLEKTVNKDLPTKSHSTTCSDGSLLSMCSSDMEEDSLGPQSRHSSRLSLHDKKSGETESDFDLGSSATPLNHSAAHHRVAVRPKRTHGAPRSKRSTQLSSALPTTPEVNEDSSIRSLSPENAIKDTHTEFYSSTKITMETKSKSSSLPPGVSSLHMESKLSRSQSNASGSSKNDEDNLEDEDEKDVGRSFIDRILYRRSGKKKKSKEEKFTKEEKFASNTSVDSSVTTTVTAYSKQTQQEVSSYKSSQTSRVVSESKPIVAPRTNAHARQRIQPMDLPGSPTAARHESPPQVQPKPSVEKLQSSSSPLNQELENLFKQSKLPPISPPKLSPCSPKPSRANLKFDHPLTSPPLKSESYFNFHENKHFGRNNFDFSSKYMETKREKMEDVRNKMKLVGLSALQEKILSTNDEEDDMAFKSLTNFSFNDESKKTVTKSHSFKCDKPNSREGNNKPDTYSFSTDEGKHKEQRKSMFKASSLDSVKNLEDATDKSFNFHNKQLDKDLLKELIISEVQKEIMENSCKRGNTVVNQTSSQTRKVLEKEYTSSLLFNSSKNSETDSECKVEEKVVEKEKTKSEQKSEEKSNSFKEINNITISGPSHTAIVNVVSNKQVTNHFISSSTETHSEIIRKCVDVEKETSKSHSAKEQQVSVTNIHLKRDNDQISSTQKDKKPEFLGRQLNKVECKPASTIVCSVNSPRIIDEQSRPKMLAFSDQGIEKPTVRKFSAEDIEIVDKDNSPTPSPKSTVTVTSQSRFKKNENFQRKSSVVSITPDPPKKEKPLTLRSVSLDSLKNDVESCDSKSSQGSLNEGEKNSSTLELNKETKSQENVTHRKKSLSSQSSNEDQPELMKVFARRSLKLKDSETEVLSQQVAVMIAESENIKKDGSDKENQSADSPKERKKSVGKESTKKVPLVELTERHKTSNESLNKNEELHKVDITKNSVEVSKAKEESIEPAIHPRCIAEKFEAKKKESDEEEVTLRKNPTNNKFLFQQRTFSVQPPKVTENNDQAKKQLNFSDRRKTENWLSNIKNEEDKKLIQDEFVKNDIITEEYISETKNFNQRKAIWEKRAQESQKKSVP